MQKADSSFRLDYDSNFVIDFLTFFHSLDATSFSMELLAGVLDSTRERPTLLRKL